MEYFQVFKALKMYAFFSKGMQLEWHSLPLPGTQEKHKNSA